MDQESTQPAAGQEPAVNDATPQNGQEPPGGTQITDPEVLQRELNEARQEAARYRTERTQSTERVTALEGQIKAIGKALGLESDDPDPNALTTELENVRSQLRSERLTNQFNRIASGVNADGELTLAYLSHKGKLSDLDPDAEDFEAKLKGRIEAALEANPKLRQGDTPNRGGGEFGSGGGKGSTLSMNELIRGAVKRP